MAAGTECSGVVGTKASEFVVVHPVADGLVVDRVEVAVSGRGALAHAAVDDSVSNKGSSGKGGSSSEGGATRAFILACSLSIILMHGVESLLTAFFSVLPLPFSFPKNSLQTVGEM